MPQNHTPAAPHELRFRWYRQVEEYGKTIKEVCLIFGISRKTYYKWYRHDHGLGSNQYKNHAIHPQTKIKDGVRVAIVKAKEKYNYGPAKMRLYLLQHEKIDVSSTAIYKFMKKKRLIRKPQKKLKWYTPLKEPFVTKKPGENVQLDVKYVPDGFGYWKYQYRFIDAASDMQYAVESYMRDARSTIKAFHGAERKLPFPITGIQTDNGGEFRGAFHDYLIHRGFIHRFIPKKSAPWNGKVERANRSVDDEFYLNMTRPWRTLGQYVHWYNHERYHLGKVLTGLTPYQKFLTLTAKVSPLKVN
jgi:transposase-like protein/transposase InsO family protein